MLAEFLQDQAALYVSGAMLAAERESFEVLVESQAELRTQVAGLQEAMTTLALAGLPPVAPPPALKARLLAAVATLPADPEPEGWVVTDATGLVKWINPAFTVMCGYTLLELEGRKPGHLLQGADTDQAEVARIRDSLRAHRACAATLVNYHKDGTRYRADIRIAPILDDHDQPVWFVARERKVPEVAAVG